MNDIIKNEIPGINPDSVAAAIEKIKNARKSPLNSIIIFMVTLAVFMSLDSLKNPLQNTVILLLVLLVHELGHLLFMKLYRYSNVQIFFIPLFGAAVSGEETSPDASRKAVISLMGPLPGILLSIPAYIIYLATGTQFFYQYSFVSLLVNGFNLLPLYPLDGGHFFDEVLFSRNKYLEIIFKAGAIIALLYISISLREWLLVVFAVLLFFSIPKNMQIAGILHNIKKDPENNMGNYSGNIPREFITRVMGHIKNYRGMNSQYVAIIVTKVWNRLYTKPPKALKSLLLIAGYIATVIIALFILAVLATADISHDENKNTKPGIENKL